MDSQRISDLSRQDQLYRYAQDLRDLIDQHASLQERYFALQRSMGQGHLNRDLLLASILEEHVPYLVTDAQGDIFEVSVQAQARLGAGALDWCGVSILKMALLEQRADLSALLSALQSDRSNMGIVQCQLALFDGHEPGSITHFEALMVPLKTHVRLELFWLLFPHVGQQRDSLSVLKSFNLLKNSNLGLLLSDARGSIVATNAALSDITGYSVAALIGQNPRLLSSGHHDTDFYSDFWAELEATGNWSGEIFNRRKSGQIYPEWKTIKAVRDASGITLAYLSVVADSSLHGEKEKLAVLAYHDALTGLPNRRLLEDRLSMSINQAQSDGTGLSLLFIDLDRFKPINDQLGHEVGDMVLQEVASRLKQSIRQGDTAARLGGDEFVILLQNVAGDDDVQAIAGTLLANLCAPLRVGAHRLMIGASMGCARFPQDSADMATLLKHADSAMYAAKHFGGNHFCFFEPEGDHKALTNLGLDLWRAPERSELFLMYQPQIDATGKLRGCEALLRWSHPTLGLLQPLSFISIAETNGAILPIGDWVLETACRQLLQWQRDGLREITLSVNVSGCQLRDPGFAGRVHQTLLRTGVPEQLIELEITETQALQTQFEGAQTLLSLRELGIKLAIDDFGVGYSSLARLHTLPVDRFKIDQSFVRDLATSPKAQAISQCFISMGLAMGMEVVAEGVETLSQHQLLVDQGCGLIQGYLTGRPMTAAALLTSFGASSPLRSAETLN